MVSTRVSPVKTHSFSPRHSAASAPGPAPRCGAGGVGTRGATGVPRPGGEKWWEPEYGKNQVFLDGYNMGRMDKYCEWVYGESSWVPT